MNVIVIAPGTQRPEGAENHRSRAAEKAGERQARSQGAPRVDFAATAQEPGSQSAKSARAPLLPQENAPPVVDGFPHLRRRTDSGSAAQAGAQDIPGHLERRKAWREAKGLNTFHAQNIAQKDEPAPDAEAHAAASQAYRAHGSASGRGKVDIDLAQRFSLTV